MHINISKPSSQYSFIHQTIFIYIHTFIPVNLTHSPHSSQSPQSLAKEFVPSITILTALAPIANTNTYIHI